MSKTIKANPMYWFLLILTLAATGGLQVWRTLFDNFAVHAIGLDGHHIGIIQSLREIPGFLALLAIYILLLIREHRLASLSILILGLGVAATGLFPSFYGLIFTTLLMSFGFHYFETVNQSLTLQHFSLAEAPIVFGLLRSRGAACNVSVGLFFLAFASSFSFATLYLFSGILIMAAALYTFRFSPLETSSEATGKNMILRRKYWLFYLLTFLAGARRQIFVAFAVFLLVKKFDFDITEIAALFLLNNLVNFFFSPFVGKCIVKFGEHRMLTIEYAALVLIFIGYTFATDKIIVALLYIGDNIFYNFAIGIKTFYQKIALHSDIAPTMAVGFTINHIAAVILPAAGGLLWLIDYRIPFYTGAGLSLVSLCCVQFMPSQLKKWHSDN